MADILDFFAHLLDSSDFNPRNSCGAGWNSGLIRLHVASDFLIWCSYLAIPCVLIYFARNPRSRLEPHSE